MAIVAIVAIVAFVAIVARKDISPLEHTQAMATSISELLIGLGSMLGWPFQQ